MIKLTSDSDSSSSITFRSNFLEIKHLDINKNEKRIEFGIRNEMYGMETKEEKRIVAR